MRFLHDRPVKTVGAVVALICLAGPTWSDEDEQEAPEESQAIEEIEEIVVIGGKPGDPIDIETRNEALLRARILVEMDRLRVLEDEYAWRKLGAENEKSTSRLKWGYDPRDEMRMRLKSDLMDIDAGETKPATIFRVEF